MDIFLFASQVELNRYDFQDFDLSLYIAPAVGWFVFQVAVDDLFKNVWGVVFLGALFHGWACVWSSMNVYYVSYMGIISCKVTTCGRFAMSCAWWQVSCTSGEYGR